MEHILSSRQFSREIIHEIFQLTDQIRQDSFDFRNSLQGHIVATLFYEPSTRTRLSFEAAVHRLGGKVISTENAKEVSSATKGESLSDTVRVLEGYCDAIVLRHHQNRAVEEVAEWSQVPIINAGGGSGEHPTQSLLDLYTIFSYKGSLDRLSVAVIGDLRFGRAVHSLVKMLSLYERITIYGVPMRGFELPVEDLQFLQEAGVEYISCKDLNQIPQNIDILYQTRTQKERFTAETLSAQELIIDERVLNRFPESTLLMHPLPRNQEISPSVDRDKRAIFFQQAHNGLYVRMALLHYILRG